MNEKGTKKNLRPAHPGNVNAVRHGAYSPRVLQPRAAETVEEIMEADHVEPLDIFAAEEIARLKALIEAIDSDLDSRGLRAKDNRPRTMVDLRLRASGKLERWLSQGLLTPATRKALTQKELRGDLTGGIDRLSVQEVTSIIERIVNLGLERMPEERHEDYVHAVRAIGERSR